jgi:hypothetical protein
MIVWDWLKLTKTMLNNDAQTMLLHCFTTLKNIDYDFKTRSIVFYIHLIIFKLIYMFLNILKNAYIKNITHILNINFIY